LTNAEETKLAQVIAAHDPTPEPLPPTADERLNKLIDLLVTKQIFTQEDIDK
jgi:hypothetical protein